MRSDAEEGEVKGEGKGLSASFGLCNIGLERNREKEVGGFVWFGIFSSIGYSREGGVPNFQICLTFKFGNVKRNPT